MTNPSPILLWLRRGDLRLSDSPALSAALATRRPVIPVFLRDEAVDALGAAPAWRLGQSVGALAQDLQRAGARLILRSGPAEVVLRALVKETGAGGVYWHRRYDPALTEIDRRVKSRLRNEGIEARSFPGNVLFEPWTVQTGSGVPFRVFTPMWNSVRGRDVQPPVRAPVRLPGPESWPDTETLKDWALGARMNRGAQVLLQYAACGSQAAETCLERFVDERLTGYREGRDDLSQPSVSGLSAFLANGEVSARTCWHRALRARQEGNPGAEAFMRQLVWREFATHTLFHAPDLRNRCWREEWSAFPWNFNENHADIQAWKQGKTGVALVDAAMREMQVTGLMHNRARMVVASLLTKNLLADWRIGLRWFEEHLIDWDAANNALGWQWVAGCGPDSAPFFRVFNPDRQAEKFDSGGAYRRRWIAEGQEDPPETARDFFRAVPRAWGLSETDPYPTGKVDLAASRARALAAWQNFRDNGVANR